MEGQNAEDAILTDGHTPIVYEVNPGDVLVSSFPDTVNQERIRKLVHLKSILEKDSKAVDIKWSLFVAACQSYRYDSILKPFPPFFLKDGEKDIESLLRVAEDTPQLSVLLKEIYNPEISTVKDHVVDLLHWVIISMREPYLRSVEKQYFDKILSRVPCIAAIPRPNYIFQVVSSSKSIKEARWNILSQNHDIIHAYHGTKLENFHSIIHYGLQQHLSKSDLFGKGIYLTSELSVSFPYSPSGFGWGASKIGSELSCIAMCEVLDNPDYVKCQNSSDELNNSRAKVPDSIGGEIPNKYYVVTNSEMVRVRYLLVYSRARRVIETPLRPNLFSWFFQHKMLTFFIAYGILLTVVGIFKNEQGMIIFNTCLKKITSIKESLCEWWSPS